MVLVKDIFIAKPSHETTLVKDDPPIWEIIEELRSELSHEEWRDQPTDEAA